jgi:uncharacterized protein
MANGFVHIELSTDDVTKAKSFYKKIFKWKLQDVPMGPGMTYTMVDAGKKATGGGMTRKMQPGSPTQWVPYVEVDDVRKTVGSARKAGAKVLVDYMEIGKNMGAFGLFVDPSGATLGVWGPVEKAKRAAKKR